MATASAGRLWLASASDARRRRRSASDPQQEPRVDEPTSRPRRQPAAPCGDGAALLAYCHRHPEDDHARLVYADWLEENGDQDRAEFVRIQVRRAGLWEGHPDDGALERRERELLAEHEGRWRACL